MPFLIPISSIFLLFERFDIVLSGYGGVHLIFDSNSFYFLLTNISCSIIVSYFLYQNGNEHVYFFFSLLHTILNLLFISNDLFNIYVILETSTLLITLLILSSEKFDQKITAIKYIFASSLAMSFYLIGIGMHYYSTGSFDISNVDGLSGYLMKFSLLAKGGFFLFGLWLPEVHSNSEPEISAMLSSVYTQSVLFPLLRIGLDDLFLFGILAFFYGVFFSIISKDLKKVLAYSSMSQLGLMVLNPLFTPVYVLYHGISKSILFLSTRYVKRDLSEKREVSVFLFLALLISLLSISGFSFTALGYVKSKLFVENFKYFKYIVSFLSAVYAGKVLKLRVVFSKRHILLFLFSIFLIYPYFNVISSLFVLLGLIFGYFLRIYFDFSITTESILTFMVFSISFFTLLGGMLW
ncbi:MULTISPECIES: proton-conducting transporter membrane subunit [unclassified Thermosipho (in: thermotogales)]|uniref:proton-conducting transporter transmembrane domain-containing protein n=1 Tax=unclassified Thermosipho (in: thermotogales) TaxID=2676525 RepID=UPI001E287F75|nr:MULTISPECIES: proton-conducting transporter membrane subunit [unclassified Thermosipho (in: thermotogales)]